MKKRIFILVFALALAVLLCACGGVEDLEKLKDIELPPLPTVGLYDEEELRSILLGLSERYPAFINATYTNDLKTISLRDKTSTDVLKLFEEDF